MRAWQISWQKRGASSKVSRWDLAALTRAIRAADRGWSIPYDLPSAPRVVEPNERMGIEFSERMRGHITTTAPEGPAGPSAINPSPESICEFTLTIISDDLEA